MPEIMIKGVTNFICRDIHLIIRDKELMVLLGPTGAGKTTLLNIIAGLARYQGTILFDNHPIDQLPAHMRKVGFLFQDLALFPHLNVHSNIAYGLRMQRLSRKNLASRVDELLDLMNIRHLSHRYPKFLSGGEKQRVALARALAPSPEILLLDEPFSSLDFRTSRYLMMELRRIQKTLGITTVYVTHSLTEAKEMADRIGILFEGRLEQVDVPGKVFLQPQPGRISDFIGAPNVLDCEQSRSLRDGLAEVSCGGIKIVAPHDKKKIQKIIISPGHVYVSREQPPGPNQTGLGV
jgi:ABC-type Fe3+/spermidine/putrescine transport system ATPase subunit